MSQLYVEAMSILSSSGAMSSVDDCGDDTLDLTKEAAGSLDFVKKQIVDYVKSVYGLTNVNLGGFQLNDQLYTIAKDDNYIVKDKLIDSQFKKYSFRIQAAATDDGQLIQIEFESSFEYAVGGRNGHRVSSFFENGRWREQR